MSFDWKRECEFETFGRWAGDRVTVFGDGTEMNDVTVFGGGTEMDDVRCIPWVPGYLRGSNTTLYDAVEKFKDITDDVRPAFERAFGNTRKWDWLLDFLRK